MPELKRSGFRRWRTRPFEVDAQQIIVVGQPNGAPCRCNGMPARVGDYLVRDGAEQRVVELEQFLDEYEPAEEFVVTMEDEA